MSLNTMKQTLSNAVGGFYAAVLGALLLTGAGGAQAQVAQTPLSVGGDVPGNLLLVPSVEFPTVDSVANLGAYSTATTYVGYFDSGKCYRYSYDAAVEANRYFYPTGWAAANHACSNGQEWSGNFLNWAATQTIDPFRKALTGGYRVLDTPTRTLLEKARSDSQSSNQYYPNRNITTGISNATPTTWTGNFYTRISRLGNKMHFARTNNVGAPDAAIATAVQYTGGSLTSGTDTNVYEVSIRVAVCYSATLLEPNCVQYGSNYKPEGLIQQYSRRIRFSAFGFLNDHAITRDGGVLRAKQKFVGPEALDPVSHVWVTNANREWDPTTGVLVRNPDSADAAATAAIVGTTTGTSSYSTGTDAAPLGTTVLQSKTITDSGVINYINRFGQMTTKTHKNYDPVSELYYTAIRYLKRQPNIAAYANNLGASANERYELADGFPVIANWDGAANDPFQYRCQKTAILGIGDVNTHRDKNLPGNRAHGGSTANEPATEPADTTVDVYTATQKVAQIEGITIGVNQFTGRENSAYLVGLAYDSHTRDIRPDLEGTQTVSTHWVDVRENQTLAGRASNQYWLAAKYGGFTVPETTPPFNPYAATVTIPLSDWHTNGDILESGDRRPDNFYVASDADKMISSLTTAFQKIVQEQTGSSASLAANSTRLDTETRTFQAQFRSGTWRGELNSYVVSPTTGALITPPAWSASSVSTLAPANWASRNIRIHNAATGMQVPFVWANLSPAQQTALGSANVVNYLRGDGSREQEEPGGVYRNRTTILGDIVNSTPVFVGRPNANLYSGASFTGAGSYGSFVTTVSGRTGVVYVGANDGMLHAFDADDGRELYAFIPNTAVIKGLRDVSDPDYAHRYFVDGDMAIADVYDTAAARWKTILVGTMGRGGPGVFALDVTDPNNILFLWERNGSDIPALGKNIGKPVIAQVANGVWKVLIGNGPESTSNTANLISINVITGASSVISTNATTGNALSAVLARDTDGDGFADTAYAGDTFGNLWKISGINTGGTASVLFVATDSANNRQPITAAPLVGRDPATGRLWVFFGTGSYLSDADFVSTQQQTWYGIQDDGTAVARAELVQRQILTTIPYNVGNVNDPTDDVFGQRSVSEGTAEELVDMKGWYMNLPASRERMVVPNRFQGSALIGTTRIPDPTDACDPSGGGYVMAINPFTGSRLDRTFFDLNGDGLFNNDDLMNGDTIISGIGFHSSPNNPIFVEDVMQVGLDDGSTKTIRTQGSSVEAQRMNWREVTN